jgi:hypothetical protein
MRISPLLLHILLGACLTIMSGCGDARAPSIQRRSEPTANRRWSHTGKSSLPPTIPRQWMRPAGRVSRFSCSSTPRNAFFCRQMREETFADQQIIELASQFVCLAVDVDQEPEICQDFHVEAFPTIQFISPQGVRLHRVLGKKDPETLAAQMQVALEPPRMSTALRGNTSLR